MISEADRVLEIGCGANPFIRDHCFRVGAHWEGVDTEKYYADIPSVATRFESVEDLSFPDEYFDFVIGTQTLEHWAEHGCKPEVGLWQCFRVLKTGGMALFNAPIHFHGSREFVEGDIERIKRLFTDITPVVSLELWARDSSPMPPLQEIPLMFQRYEKSGVFQIDIRARRPSLVMPRPKGYRFSSRLIRELLDHRFSYLVWKTWRKGRMQLLPMITKYI